MISTEKPGTPEELLHYGVKGMKWGVRRERTSSPELKRKAAQALKTKALPVMKTRVEQMFNIKPLTRRDYEKMSTKPTSMPSGKTLYRLTRDPSDTSLDGFTFVTTSKRDALIYRGLLPAQRIFEPFRKSDYKQHYEVSLKTTKRLRGPSERARVDILASLMSDKTAINGKRSLREQLKKNNAITRREAKTLTDVDLALRFHAEVHQNMWMRDNPVTKSFVKKVTDLGYDMLSDDNDSGLVSRNPVMVLSPKSSTKLDETTTLSNDDILNAQLRLQFPGKRKVTE